MPGYDLVAGTPATPATADVFITLVEDGSGYVQSVTLNAPHGALVLPTSQMCDVASAPLDGYSTTISLGTPFSAYLLGERTSTIIVRTGDGRYAKLSVECNCPSGGGGVGTGMAMMGLRFGVVLSSPATTSFPQ